MVKSDAMVNGFSGALEKAAISFSAFRTANEVIFPTRRLSKGN